MVNDQRAGMPCMLRLQECSGTSCIGATLSFVASAAVCRCFLLLLCLWRFLFAAADPASAFTAPNDVCSFVIRIKKEVHVQVICPLLAL
jgi:hypothetical protein